MRKRALPVGAGLVVVALLLIAPGVASAGVFVPWGGAFGNITEATPPTIPLHAGGPVAPGGQFGNITEATPPATVFAGGVLVPWGGPFGNITIETAPALPFVAGVWAPWGGQFGNVTIDMPPATPFVAGVSVPWGGQFGNVTIEKTLSTKTDSPSVSESPATPKTNSCYQGACPATVLGGTGPSASVYGSDIHSYGPQQALRQGVFGGGFAVAATYSF